jgi:hypothetical protein
MLNSLILYCHFHIILFFAKAFPIKLTLFLMIKPSFGCGETMYVCVCMNVYLFICLCMRAGISMFIYVCVCVCV